MELDDLATDCQRRAVEMADELAGFAQDLERRNAEMADELAAFDRDGLLSLFSDGCG